ncbi:MAG: VWA domain-containing protein, partial [Blastocatellia bacterium]
VLQSPVIVPGVTTVQAVYGEAPGSDPKRIPVDLDIYVDASGSMPNPGVSVSYLALAGTILALSALRAGATVQATLWSGPKEFETTGGFIREENEILGVITGAIGRSTAFPLHILRDTYEARSIPKAGPAHIVVISDDGADTMLQNDEHGQPGEAICVRALQRAGSGGTLVLNLLQNSGWRAQEKMEQIGFVVNRVSRWEDLVQFARDFVRRVYRSND